MSEYWGTTPLLPEIVQDLTQYYTGLWWGSNPDFPLLAHTFTPQEQRQNGARLDQLNSDLLAALKRHYKTRDERLIARDELLAKAEVFAQTRLGFESRHINIIRKYHLAEIIAEFSEQARSFDPEISGEDIYQASRNVWSMNFMQLLLGLPVQLTPAIFAYSMLYPYTDNYLDDPSISPKLKLDFNLRFNQRLKGEPAQTANSSEEKIWRLIEIVESQFDRQSCPQVYESLSAIQEAQTRSLSLIKSGADPYEIDVLGISIEKGGTAVLADGYLVAGDLTESQRSFMFGYGVFTQLMDDQEDVEHDMKAGLNTVFSLTAHHWPLDRVTNRTFHLAANVLNCMDNFEGAEISTVKELFSRGIDLILIDAAGRNRSYYSWEYLSQLERYFPFRFYNLNHQRRRLQRYKITIGKLLELAV